MWTALERGLKIGDTINMPTDLQATEDFGASICQPCPVSEACDGANQKAVEEDDPDLYESCGCQGDGFGLGTQSCSPLYRGLLCSTCVKGYYPDSTLRCIGCPEPNDYLKVVCLACC